MKENDKTSHRAELMRDIVAMVNQNPVLKQAWQRKKEKSIQNTEFEYPEHLSVEHIDMGLFKMEYLTWNGSGESIRDPTASWWWLHVRVAGTVPEDGRALRRDQQWSGSAFCGLPAGTGVPISGGIRRCGCRI